MAKYIINGGNKLHGKIHISGNKNSVLPCLAASLLTAEEVILKNVPNISDVGVMCQILEQLGAKVQREDHTVHILTSKITHTTLPLELTNKLRASVLLVGPLLSRVGKAEFGHPGGDVIGKRSIDAHLQGFSEIGFKVSQSDRSYKAERKLSLGHKSWTVFFEEASVTATENTIMAAVLGNQSIILQNCAHEPHIIDLCTMLVSMGAIIEGIGSSTLKIQGVDKLHGTEFTIGSDFIELGTFAVAAAVTQGKIEVENIQLDGLEPITYHFKRMGIHFEQKGDSVLLSNGEIYPIAKLHTNLWPGFPSDMMSVAIVLATQAKGVSLMHDWMYESRMFFVDKLISMGANITIADPHRVVVYGPTKLIGRNLETPDIRAGMALVLASLFAKGTSTINRAELIERGYEDATAKLQSLGADIQRIE